jgi:hypothetical protein
VIDDPMNTRMPQNLLTVCLAALLVTGCQPAAPSPPVVPSGPTEVDFSQHNDSGTITGEPPSPDAILSTDPAASRLQDIGGLMLLYYRDHKQLPPTLDELAAMPGGDSLNLAAPRSNREFAYQPNGLWSPEHPDKCIIAYDPDLVGASRWCLLMTPPTNGAALVVTVLAIPENHFVKYRRTAQ